MLHATVYDIEIDGVAFNGKSRGLEITNVCVVFAYRKTVTKKNALNVKIERKRRKKSRNHLFNFIPVNGN